MTPPGIREGGSLFVHCSLKAIGAGVRAEDVIASLRSAIGERGTLLMPTFTTRREEHFDPASTPSAMGAVTEVFRRMPGVLRSRHPRHPVAARGPLAEVMLKGHEDAIGPCGADTPFERHARTPGSQVLLVGVDLDTLTLLHTAEALLDLAYLRDLEGRYLDAAGRERTITMRQAPGGHRGGVRAFEKTLRARDRVQYGSMGDAKTMLFDAGPLLDVMIELLRPDPMAALCPHDACPDCNWFKGRVRAHRLAEECITLIPALASEPADRPQFTQMLEAWGAGGRFELRDEIPTEAYRPLQAARAGKNPFYDLMYKGSFRDTVTDIVVEDELTGLQGMIAPPQSYVARLAAGPIALGDGHAQLREIVSALRMRRRPINYHLIIPDGDAFATTWRQLNQFWNLLP